MEAASSPTHKVSTSNANCPLHQPERSRHEPAASHRLDTQSMHRPPPKPSQNERRRELSLSASGGNCWGGGSAPNRQAPRVQPSSNSSLESRALSYSVFPCQYGFYAVLAAGIEKSSRPA